MSLAQCKITQQTYRIDRAMRSLRSVIWCLILPLILLVNNITCKCVLQLTPTNKPLITQKFGSKEILLTNLEIQLNVDDSAKVQAYCSVGFNPFNVISNRNGYRQEINYNARNKQHLTFICLFDKLYVYEESDNIIPKVDENEWIARYSIGCSGSEYSMYESRDKLPNCDKAMSYALGAKLNIPIILAGLCYQLEELHMKYISYKLHEPFTILEKAQQYYPEGLNSTSLAEQLLPIENFYQFPSQANIINYVTQAASDNFWLRIADYELDSIVQTNNTFRQKLDDYKNLFDILWWRNLRAGNWRRFMDLLEKRTDDGVEYNVYAGTSGTVRVPMLNNCENDTTLIMNYKGNKRIFPQFVWTYVKSMDEDVVEDFVVISYNSPYFEYFDKNSTVLCSDILDEIDWLKPLRDSRYISTLGVLYCCRPQDVEGVLDGFPKQTQPTYATTISPEKIQIQGV